MFELIYQYIKLINELVVNICLVAQVRKVGRGLSLNLQLSFHVVSSRAEDINQTAMSTSDDFTPRVMVAGIGIVLATLSCVKRLIDEFMDVLHGSVHDMNEIRRSVQRMEQRLAEQPNDFTQEQSVGDQLDDYRRFEDRFLFGDSSDEGDVYYAGSGHS